MSSTIYRPKTVVPRHNTYYVVVDEFGKELHDCFITDLQRFPDFSDLPYSDEIPSAFGYSTVQLLPNWTMRRSSASGYSALQPLPNWTPMG